MAYENKEWLAEIKDSFAFMDKTINNIKKDINIGGNVTKKCNRELDYNTSTSRRSRKPCTTCQSAPPLTIISWLPIRVISIIIVYRSLSAFNSTLPIIGLTCSD